MLLFEVPVPEPVAVRNLMTALTVEDVPVPLPVAVRSMADWL
jgi:hypothetical protein